MPGSRRSRSRHELACPRGAPAEEAVEQRAGASGFEGVPHLPQDLSLAGHHRVETGRDAEEVQRGGFVCEPVQHRLETRRVLAREREERATARCSSRASSLGREVDLGAVARREDDRLAPVGERGERDRRAGEVDGDMLAQLDRSLVVRHADERELHEAKCVSGRTPATSARPSREQPRDTAPAEPGLSAQDEDGGVRSPDEDGDHHRRIEVAALERRGPPRSRP